MVHKISEHGNRSPEEVTWTTVVKIEETGLANINFYRPTPFCKDGSREGMVELLNGMGWEASTMMGITGKSGLSPEEFTDAYNFIEAYKNVYVRIVGHPHDDIPLTLQEFLDRVEDEKKIIGLKQMKIVSIEEVIEMLTAKGFELIEDN